MPDEPTLSFYAQNAARYVRHGSSQPSRYLVAFLALLPAGSKVLELGTGSGRDAAHMMASGFVVDATDASPELATQAQARIGHPVRLMRFDQLEDEAAYDAVWASASLLHAPATELTEDLVRIHRALRAGGLFVASFKAGAGEGRDPFGRYYNYPDRGTLQAHYESAAAWAELDIQTTTGTGYDGLSTQWLWVTVRK